MWGYCIQHKRECITSPCITLQRVDSVYNTNGLGQALVVKMLTGLYKTSFGKAHYEADAFNLAADQFVSRNGSTCTLYQMMLYFGGYLSDYKSTMASWDIGDILRSYQTKFLPKLETWLEAYKPKVEEAASNIPVGREALLLYLRREHAKGTDIRQLFSVKIGLSRGTLTEEDLNFDRPI